MYVFLVFEGKQVTYSASLPLPHRGDILIYQEARYIVLDLEFNLDKNCISILTERQT